MRCPWAVIVVACLFTSQDSPHTSYQPLPWRAHPRLTCVQHSLMFVDPGDHLQIMWGPVFWRASRILDRPCRSMLHLPSKHGMHTTLDRCRPRVLQLHGSQCHLVSLNRRACLAACRSNRTSHVACFGNDRTVQRPRPQLGTPFALHLRMPTSTVDPDLATGMMLARTTPVSTLLTWPHLQLSVLDLTHVSHVGVLLAQAAASQPSQPQS